LIATPTTLAAQNVDFFLSGRRLPAWVTGIAFVSANLGAVEIMGMSANGAQIGLATMHYYWIGAVPAMLFLGVVMMPFYYGSKVRSVPEFMRRRFGTGAHLVNAISFAVAQVLIAGVNRSYWRRSSTRCSAGRSGCHWWSRRWSR
jgi:SSS family solute:Na+ symporter